MKEEGTKTSLPLCSFCFRPLLPRSSRLDILALTSSLRGRLQDLFDVLFWKECHQARTLCSNQTGGGQKLRPLAGWEGKERRIKYETNKKCNGNFFVSQHFAVKVADSVQNG